ncbi:MAG: hypothetical protein Q9195_005353 [Heterodermia aff. obscurata]
MNLPSIFPTVAAIFSLPIIKLALTTATSNTWKNGSLSLPSLNVTSLDIPPDRRFRINQVYSDEAIAKDDCLVVGFWLMAQLATKEWSSNITLAGGPRLANFPRVSIDVAPQQPLSELPIRYAIWGLKLAMLDLLARDRFVESIYELYWDHLTVGTIYIQPSRNIQASTPPQDYDVKVSNQNLSAPFSLDQPINIAIQPIPGAQPINPRDIWITMFESQERLAYPEAYLIPTTDFQMGPFLPSSNAFVSLDPLHGPDLPRLFPPFLHVSTVCHALMLLAVWMCLNNRFSDFGFTISVSDTLVGSGRLSEVRTLSSGLASNVSTS